MKHFTPKLNQLWRLTAILLCMVISPQRSVAQSYETQIDGIYYLLRSDTAEVKSNTGTMYSGDVVIPPTVEYNGTTYTVTSIDQNAFHSCTNLNSVTIGPNVHWIKYNAFGHSGITSLTIPATVLGMDYPLTTGCENLASIVVESGNPNYDSRDNCNAIIRTNSNSLMVGCKTTVIPGTVKELLYNSFSYKSLTSIDIPSSVKILQPGVFASSGLQSITIPASLTSIFDNPFQRCSDLTSIVVEQGNPRYDSRDNCNGIVETSTNTLVTAVPTTVIPTTVIRLGEMVFGNRDDLTSFEIPEQIVELKNNAFYGCSKLQSITIPNNVETIGQGAFCYCYNMTTATLGSGVKNLGSGIFYNCSNLTDLYVKALSVPTANGNPLETLNTSKVKIHVPTSAKASYEASYPWNSYTLVDDEGGGGGGEPTQQLSGTTGDLTWEATQLDGNVLVWENGQDVPYPRYRLTISGNGFTADYNADYSTGTCDAPWYALKGITELVVGEGVKGLGRYAFYELQNLTQATLPSTLQVIGTNTFMNSGLTSITLPEGLEKLDYGAFYFCPLQSITIPASVTTVRATSFQGNRLQSVVVAAGNTVYDSRDNCNAIIVTATNELLVATPSMTFPASVTKIGSQAYYNNYNFKTISIPEGITEIGSDAMAYMGSLESLELPNSLQILGDRALRGNRKLTTLTLGENLTTIGTNMFDNCTAMTDVYCYANPANLAWANYDASNFFQTGKVKTIDASEALTEQRMQREAGNRVVAKQRMGRPVVHRTKPLLKVALVEDIAEFYHIVNLYTIS